MWTRIWTWPVGLLFVSCVSFAQEPVAEAGEQMAPSASGCVAPGPESAPQALPEVQQLGAVRFVTGGIGVDEARAMLGERAKYPLAMTFVQSYGDKSQFLAHILVEIRRDDGTPVLCATSSGPYLFVDLPAGRYHVAATTDGGRLIERKVNLAAGGHVDLTLVWPASAAAH
ncbi:carboxypeptidase regulatory-like domain-containing protein [Fontimonas sp. SYSU GA230001]|uniref:carboxypeptidase regulatory-like domain-containing protein n=1 Tax=Fontimonas sp. SYSU GA230001 TaxID=3142450 RepID=UPI0032B5C81B